MATYIPELNAMGHCPGFAVWLARLIARGGATTVLALPGSTAGSPEFQEQLELAVGDGVRVMSLDRSTVSYCPVGGAEACDWISGWEAPHKGDRLIIPTLDYLLMAENELSTSPGITLEGVYHQPMTLLPLVPPIREFLKRGLDLRERERRRSEWQKLRTLGLKRTYLLDPYEAIGPGRKRMQRCLGSDGGSIAYLPVGSLNTFGFKGKTGCRKELGIDESAPFLVIPGNPDSRKDIGTLIRAWPKVRARVPEATLGIFGYRPPYVRDWGKMIGEGIIYQEGTLPQSTMLGIIREADAVWAVRSSTVGMSSIQDLALQLGSVAIVSRSNRTSSWLADEFGGVQVTPRDVNSVARGVAKALGKPSRSEPVDLGVMSDFRIAASVLSGDRLLSNTDLPPGLQS